MGKNEIKSGVDVIQDEGVGPSGLSAVKKVCMIVRGNVVRYGERAVIIYALSKAVVIATLIIYTTGDIEWGVFVGMADLLTNMALYALVANRLRRKFGINLPFIKASESDP